MIDLIFTNKPDRVIKTYNLITGPSDHNLVLIARKLNKSRYINKKQSNKQCKIAHIPKRNQELLKNDLNEIDWASKIDRESCVYMQQYYNCYKE